MQPILKHNLEHNGLHNASQWIGFRFEDSEWGVLEIDERNTGYPDKWYYHVVGDPEGPIPRYSVNTFDLNVMYALQLEKFVQTIIGVVS